MLSPLLYRLTRFTCISFLGVGCILGYLEAELPPDSSSPAPPAYPTQLQRSFSLQMGNSDMNWEKLNQIHNGSKQIFGIEYSQLFSQSYRMHAWFSAGYSTKHGASTLGKFSTRYHYLPFGVGIKHTIPLTSKIDLNIGAGALLSLLRIRSNTPLVESVICRWNSGAIVKVQLEYSLTPSFFIGGFIDTIYQRYTTKNTPEQGTAQVIDFSGTHYGLRLGWRW